MTPDLLIQLLTFLLGLFLGNRLTLWREKRKEFNEAAKPVREWLLKANDEVNPYAPEPTKYELDRFLNLLWWWKRRRFEFHYRRYFDELRLAEVQDPVYGSTSYPDTTKVMNAINRMIAFTNAR